MLSAEQKAVYLVEEGDLCPAGPGQAFIACAVIVEPGDREALSEAIRAIRTQELGRAELMAEAVEHGARFRILRALLTQPFQVLYVLVDKGQLYPQGCSDWKNIRRAATTTLFAMLQRTGEPLRIVFDGSFSGQFLPAFQNYVESQGGQLFSPYQFAQEDRGNCNLLQLSRFVADMLLLASKSGAPKHHSAYLNFLRDKIIGSALFPRPYEEYGRGANGIAQWSIRAAVDYIREHENSNIPEELNRVIVVDRLLFQLQLDPQKYLGTAVLRELINNTSGYDYSDSQFRAQVIAPLRDAGLLISSSARGYKIPLTIEEVLSYSLHTLQMIYPMLERLAKCRSAVLEATNNECDILEQPEYEKIRAYFDAR